MSMNTEITLEQLLQAREQRAGKQKTLIEQYGMPLVSFMVNFPGARKKTPLSTKIFGEGYRVLVHKIEDNGVVCTYRETDGQDTGHEGFIVVDAKEEDLKRFVLEIENEHPLGRLFDFDVIGRDGTAVSRVELGHPKRKCLLCGEEALVCARSRRHPVNELTDKIQEMVDQFYSTKPIKTI